MSTNKRVCTFCLGEKKESICLGSVLLRLPKMSSFMYISDLLNMLITSPENKVILFHKEIRYLHKCKTHLGIRFSDCC